MIPEALEYVLSIIEHDHAVPRIAPRSPEEPRLVTAERRRQAVAPAEEVNGAGLSVVLRKDAAIAAFLRGEPVPGDRSFGDDLFPAKLVGIMLRQHRSVVGVLRARRFDGEVLHVGDEFVRGKNGDDNRSQMRAAGEKENDDHRFQPGAPRRSRLGTFDGGLDQHRSRCQQHGIHRREIVILAVKHEQNGESNQITPAEQSIRFQSRRKKETEQPGDPYGRGEGVNQQGLLEEIL